MELLNEVFHHSEGSATTPKTKFDGRMAARFFDEHSGEEWPIWMDYFCLRQTGSDFSLPATLKLIEHTQAFVCAPQNMEYFTRMFCVFELYAAVEGGEQEIWMAQVIEKSADKAVFSVRCYNFSCQGVQKSARSDTRILGGE